MDSSASSLSTPVRTLSPAPIELPQIENKGPTWGSTARKTAIIVCALLALAAAGFLFYLGAIQFGQASLVNSITHFFLPGGVITLLGSGFIGYVIRTATRHSAPKVEEAEKPSASGIKSDEGIPSGGGTLAPQFDPGAFLSALPEDIDLCKARTQELQPANYTAFILHVGALENVSLVVSEAIASDPKKFGDVNQSQFTIQFKQQMFNHLITGEADPEAVLDPVIQYHASHFGMLLDNYASAPKLTAKVFSVMKAEQKQSFLATLPTQGDKDQVALKCCTTIKDKNDLLNALLLLLIPEEQQRNIFFAKNPAQFIALEQYHSQWAAVYMVELEGGNPHRATMDQSPISKTIIKDCIDNVKEIPFLELHIDDLKREASERNNTANFSQFINTFAKLGQATQSRFFEELGSEKGSFMAKACQVIKVHDDNYQSLWKLFASETEFWSSLFISKDQILQELHINALLDAMTIEKVEAFVQPMEKDTILGTSDFTRLFLVRMDHYEKILQAKGWEEAKAALVKDPLYAEAGKIKAKSIHINKLHGLFKELCTQKNGSRIAILLFSQLPNFDADKAKYIEKTDKEQLKKMVANIKSRNEMLSSDERVVLGAIIATDKGKKAFKSELEALNAIANPPSV